MSQTFQQFQSFIAEQTARKPRRKGPKPETANPAYRHAYSWTGPLRHTPAINRPVPRRPQKVCPIAATRRNAGRIRYCQWLRCFYRSQGRQRPSIWRAKTDHYRPRKSRGHRWNCSHICRVQRLVCWPINPPLIYYPPTKTGDSHHRVARLKINHLCLP